MVSEWLKKVIKWNGFVILIFVVMAGYFLVIGSPTFMRDAGIAIAGGFVGNLVYEGWKKIYSE